MRTTQDLSLLRRPCEGVRTDEQLDASTSVYMEDVSRVWTSPAAFFSVYVDTAHRRYVGVLLNLI